MDYKVFPFVKEDLQETGIIKGLGSTFMGKPDSYKDLIAPGSFTKSLAKNGRGGMGFAFLYQHDHTLPVGVWDSITENHKGLPVEGRFAMKTQLGQESFELTKMGALKAFSIGFDMPRTKSGKVDPNSYDFDQKTGIRLLKQIDLWEVSLVTFPANTRARVTGIKSFEDAKTVRDLEYILRESGLSKNQASYVASMCKSGLRDSGADEMEDLLEIAKATNAGMQNYSLLAGLLNDLKSVNSNLS
jgi:hypothetical protein